MDCTFFMAPPASSASNPYLLALFGAIPAAIVAAIAALIAWRQYVTAQAKLQLDLFDKRYELYEVLWGALSVTPGDEDDFLSEVVSTMGSVLPKYNFLFDAEVHKFAEKVYLKIELMRRRLRESRLDVMDREEARREVVKIHDWLVAEKAGLVARFAPFMAYSEWSHSGNVLDMLKWIAARFSLRRS